MKLRVRLLVGYGYLVALLLLTAGSGMLGFLQLSEGIDVILEENFRSISASTHMLEALERQDSATLLLLLDEQTDRADMERFQKAFSDALEEAQANITEDDEEEILARIRSGFDLYKLRRDALLAEVSDRPLRAYNDRVQPVFTSVKVDVLRLLDVNHNAMMNADQEARTAALQNGAGIGVLVAVALLSMVIMSRAMHRRLLEPLQELVDTLGAIAQGEDRRRLRTLGEDELAQVASHFNSTLDRQMELRAQMRGRLSQQKQLALALISHLGEPVLVLGLDGLVMADAFGELRWQIEAELVEWVLGPGDRLLRGLPRGEQPEPTELELPGGHRLRIELLQVQGRRPVAWLVRPANPATRASCRQGESDAVPEPR
ncbi:MAG: HAMP domain-containing protein [Acidobacteria bacterium]|nr:HAMP domain-containing protein [Acidobacteriota bacterium]